MALATSCTSKHAPPAKTKSAAVVASAAANAAGAPSDRAPSSVLPLACNAPAPVPLTTTALGALVNDWRRAQKSRDFPGYSALYADHFAGFVAAGTSVARVDRSAWLHAHQASLSLDPALGSAAMHIAVGAGGAQITFSASAPHSAGSRLPELFVVSTAAGPRIAREAPMPTPPSELYARPGQWLADQRFAILSTAPDAAWSEGAPRFEGDGVATTAVVTSRLPKALRAWLGRPVRVLGESGTVCETRLQRFAIRAQVSPDLPTAEVWDGCSDEHGPSSAVIAEDIWRLSAFAGRTLIAEFSATCKGALFAVDPDLDPPVVAAPELASAELGAAALAAFRELPEYAQTQARFRAEDPGGSGAWDDREARRSVWSLELQGHAPLVFVSAQAGLGCGHFSGSLSALWEIHGVGASAALTLLLVPHAEDDQRLTPRALIDFGAGNAGLEGGGASVLLGPDGVYAARTLLSRTPAKNQIGYHQTLLTSVPFFAGPC